MIHSWLTFLSRLMLPRRWERLHYAPLLKLNASDLDKQGWAPELAILKKLLNPGKGLFIDIGAGTGLYSYVAKHRIGSRNVLAFEPLDDAVYYVFSRRGPITSPNWVHWSNFAISNHKNEVPIYIPRIKGLWKYSEASLYHQHFTQNHLSYKRQFVKMTTLDSYLGSLPAHGEVKVQMIKMDIQGAELEATQGMSHLLKTQSPIIQIQIEERYNKNYYKVFHLLMEYGYRHCYQLDRSRYRLNEIPYPDSMEGTASSQFYFTQKAIQ